LRQQAGTELFNKMMEPPSQKPHEDDGTDLPFIGNWGPIYLGVLCWLLFVMTALYVISRTFTY
jgi:hypothetical protein